VGHLHVDVHHRDPLGPEAPPDLPEDSPVVRREREHVVAEDHVERPRAEPEAGGVHAAETMGRAQPGVVRAAIEVHRRVASRSDDAADRHDLGRGPGGTDVEDLAARAEAGSDEAAKEDQEGAMPRLRAAAGAEARTCPHPGAGDVAGEGREAAPARQAGHARARTRHRIIVQAGHRPAGRPRPPAEKPVPPGGRVSYTRQTGWAGC